MWGYAHASCIQQASIHSIWLKLKQGRYNSRRDADQWLGDGICNPRFWVRTPNSIYVDQFVVECPSSYLIVSCTCISHVFVDTRTSHAPKTCFGIILSKPHFGKTTPLSTKPPPFPLLAFCLVHQFHYSVFCVHHGQI
ncbi:hypothetical protein VNO77_19592 [Canavalia gladiata]|uniref:Uncharacterized protein n=1 Tax=Canavalia gladiata TaxID=3824 RepID=A0AAN9QPS2_CANGL